MEMFSEVELDVVNELTNIGVGRAAASLSELVRSEIELNVPQCRILPKDEAFGLLSTKMKREVVAIREAFEGAFQGDGLLIFPKESSLELVRSLVPDHVPLESLTELEQDALIEVGNIILNACIGTYGNLMKQHMKTELPVLFRGSNKQFLQSLDQLFSPSDLVIFLDVTFSIKTKNVQGYVVFLMDLDSEKNFRDSIKEYIDNLSTQL